MIARSHCFILIAGIAAAGSANAAEPVNFAPHRAIYDINLTNAASGSGVGGLSGRMVYELSGSSCEGYTQNMRFVTRMSNQDGGETVNDLRNSSWEDASGKRLRFSTTQYANDDVVEASQGDAQRDKAGAKVSVDLTKPSKSHFALPMHTLFPMQHAASLIQAARNGQKILSSNVYDGSEKGNKVYLTNAVIGKPESSGARKSLASVKEGARLAPLQSWPMSISYFDLGNDKQDAPPAYEISYHFYENGVTTDLAIDYGEFAIKGELKDLTFLPESPCTSREH